MAENTISNPARWKGHHWSAQKMCYKRSLGGKAFRENFDAIRWVQSFDMEEPSEGRMVYCAAGEGVVMFHVGDDYVLQDGESFVERA